LGELFVGGCVIGRQKNGLASEGGFDGVVGGLGFASIRLGTGAGLAVGAIGVDLSL